jgi:hypothetical protein
MRITSCPLVSHRSRNSVQIEELSNQNEDLIQKLKESMERELVLR